MSRRAASMAAKVAPPAPEEIRRLRLALSMTNRQFADFAGVSLRAVKYWQAPVSSRSHAYPHPARWALIKERLRDAGIL